MSRCFGPAGSDLSIGHFDPGSEVSRALLGVPEVQNVSGHFGPRSEVSWVQSFLGPKCPVTVFCVWVHFHYPQSYGRIRPFTYYIMQKDYFVPPLPHITDTTHPTLYVKSVTSEYLF